MANSKVEILRVNSCNLGKLGSDDVALKINFSTPATASNPKHNRSAVFGLSKEAARGLAQALAAMVKEPAASARQHAPN
jgi:hypothetical protein